MANMILSCFSGPLTGDDEIVRGLMASAWANFAIYAEQAASPGLL